MKHLGRNIGTIVGASVLLLAGAACGETNLQSQQQAAHREDTAAEQPGSGQQNPGGGTGEPGDATSGPGSGKGQPGDGGDDPVSSTDPTAKQLPPERVRDESKPRAGNASPPVWVLNDGRTVRVTGVEGGCSKAAARVAAQEADHVRISIVETVPTSPGQQCTMDMRFPKLNVQLDAPLGERNVVIQRAASRK